jgi:hypothetical protein
MTRGQMNTNKNKTHASLRVSSCQPSQVSTQKIAVTATPIMMYKQSKSNKK